MMSLYLEDDEGVPYAVPEESAQDWARTLTQEKRRVAKDEVDGYLISTVFLGMDHRYGEGEPLLYETMVFGADGVGKECFMERYSTRKDALEGHKSITEAVSKLGMEGAGEY